MTDSIDLHAAAKAAKAWPFQEAARLLERVRGAVPEKGHVLFETGYGPSGLPHIGTFGEVVRTTMVRNAFMAMSDIPTRLVAFSDDMDGLRKVPDNVPNQAAMADYAETKDASGLVLRDPSPLTSVPDPFGEYESFAHHNNARLRGFLDGFGFDYEFASATETYRSGAFNEVILRILERYDAVRNVVLPELGPERRKTYTPLFPVVEKPDERLDGKPRRQVLHRAVIVEANVANGTAVFQLLTPAGDPDGPPFEHSVLDGNCKAQWRVDWALRWTALEVDYEMSGKDLIDSVRLSGRICKILGGTPPENFTYELFLDENGEKISKSKGNGLAVEDWLRYAPQESLSLFMFQQPRRAKRLYFDAIPKSVDDYLTFVGKYREQDAAERLENPAWHIHGGDPPAEAPPLSFAILLNLASVCNAEDKSVLWGFISRYTTGATPESEPMLDRLSEYAVRYYHDFVKPAKRYRPPSEIERAALEELDAALGAMPENASAEDIQTEVYEIGKRHPFETLRDWFKAQYEVLLGQSQGPRMGSFIALFGIAESRALIARALRGEDLNAN
jgi:lysyl-tRNA synthetase class 1